MRTGDPGYRGAVEISVLGSFSFATADGARPPLSGSTQRLLAFLALRHEGVARDAAAESLWPSVSEDHASSSLRSALARMSGPTRDAVTTTPNALRLCESVAVDISDSRAVALRLAAPPTDADDRELSRLGTRTMARLSSDLLPDWYDDWIVPEAEDWRQLRVRSLEGLSERLLRAGRFAQAMSAALAAVRVEPLRESATAAVIRVHLAEGNPAEAQREFRRYRALLQRELGVEPTPSLFALAGTATGASRRAVDTRVDREKWSEVRRARRVR